MNIEPKTILATERDGVPFLTGERILSILFDGEDGEEVEARTAAEAWCAEQGISVGRLQRRAPRGLAWGDYDIAKWRGLDRYDRERLDGRMEYVGGIRGIRVLIRMRRPAEVNPWSREAQDRLDEIREARCGCRPGHVCMECAEALAENHL